MARPPSSSRVSRLIVLPLVLLLPGCARPRKAELAACRAMHAQGERDASHRSDHAARPAVMAPSKDEGAARVPAEATRPALAEGQGAATGILEDRRSNESTQQAVRAASISLAPAILGQAGELDREQYAHVEEAGFRRATDQPLSTFSIDVDTASYSNVRRFIEQGTMPPPGAVRIEEMLNYFRYDDPEPSGSEPFSTSAEVAGCPWAPEHRLVRIGLRGRSIAEADVPPRNLVFLVDVSGSMESPDKLPLVKAGLSLLAERLRPADRVGIVVYAGAAGTVLDPTSDRDAVRAALDRLQAGGSTNGEQGIQLAYDLAAAGLRKGGVNRVVLATDGDFNVGVTSQDALVRLIEKERARGIFLTVLGFGTGNLQDATMEMLADKGNGNYAYVDSLEEARKVLVREAGSTLVTIAKDVKIQVEWNPATVEAWRLVGYEDRALAAEDFNDDRKDAGEIGAGHAVTALYEVVPRGGAVPGASVDPLRYQEPTHLTSAASSGDLCTVKLRFKQPDADSSELLTRTLRDSGGELEDASDDLRFAAAVAEMGMLLRGSELAGSATWSQVSELARGSVGRDEHGDRAGFVALAEKARALAGPAQVAVTR